MGDTPVPIPNTMVKTQAADGTILETIWESRWLPEHLMRTSEAQFEFSERRVTTLSESVARG